ncbi:SdiA-regulated domain-containing protein [Mucilaginibacter ginkgonis]|uniref:SdiA-regulated domain-containing protein n=1 Tax=Mucilaginibacter ginkgonis TaxID=2682091 RepID=A0A6I4I3W1_9SPHI|nr:SdiA-regulated domain-containing protein [Mucilaginibacter ginkgonis]QQL49079.1 SdiA-regulated domain-containing protein [Mucilaginibacter ginkgonis]
MKIQLKYLATLALAGGIFMLMACKPKRDYPSPPGYNLNKPQKFNMPDDLEEISGIAFYKGNPDVLYAEEDESGRVYYLKPPYKKQKHSIFKDSGDFEDIALCSDRVIMLQSKGRLYTFPLAETQNPRVEHVQRFEDMLPKGQYEGMYADSATNQVYVMCKHCDIDKTSKQTSGFIFQLGADGSLKQTDTFKINVKHIADQLSDPKINFHPSALAQNKRSKNWFVLSSVNKLLVILNEKFKVQQVYKLNPEFFPQPEGMAFDDKNNLYISNEGDKLEPGNVLKFEWHGR